MAVQRNVITAQTGARQFDGEKLTKYSMFVGGTNATHHALEQYSPLMNGFGRLFMVRPPKAILKMFAEDKDEYSSKSLFMQFKHILEYMNRSVTGFGDKTLDAAGTPIQGGFAGRQFNTPTVTRDTTSSITIGLYELVGSPVYTVIDGWMNAIGDENSGLATYGGYISGGLGTNNQQTRLYSTNSSDTTAFEFNEANHTAEFIYVMHDRSGAQVERAVLLADCYPTGISQSAVLDMATGGSHDNVTYEVVFNCVAYRSPIINAIASDLLKQYMIVANSLNFNPELGDAVYATSTVKNVTSLGVDTTALGEVPSDGALGTDVGNVPVYSASNTAETNYVKTKPQTGYTFTNGYREPKPKTTDPTNPTA